MPQAILRSWASFLPWINHQHYDSARTVKSMASPNLTQPLILILALFIYESSVCMLWWQECLQVFQGLCWDTGGTRSMTYIFTVNTFLTQNSTQITANSGICLCSTQQKDTVLQPGMWTYKSVAEPSCFWCWLACKCPQGVPEQLNTLKWKPCVMLQGLKFCVSNSNAIIAIV